MLAVHARSPRLTDAVDTLLLRAHVPTDTPHDTVSIVCPKPRHVAPQPLHLATWHLATWHLATWHLRIWSKMSVIDHSDRHRHVRVHVAEITHLRERIRPRS